MSAGAPGPAAILYRTGIPLVQFVCMGAVYAMDYGGRVLSGRLDGSPGLDDRLFPDRQLDLAAVVVAKLILYGFWLLCGLGLAIVPSMTRKHTNDDDSENASIASMVSDLEFGATDEKGRNKSKKTRTASTAGTTCTSLMSVRYPNRSEEDKERCDTDGFGE